MADNHPKGHPETEPPAATIDARGLACPLPVLRLRKVLLAQPAGTLVELLATDRASLRDVPAFCESAGHRLERAFDGKDVLRFLVRRA